MNENKILCKGDWALGTACRKCERCKATLPQPPMPPQMRQINDDGSFMMTGVIMEIGLALAITMLAIEMLS